MENIFLYFKIYKILRGKDYSINITGDHSYIGTLVF